MYEVCKYRVLLYSNRDKMELHVAVATRATRLRDGAE